LQWQGASRLNSSDFGRAFSPGFQPRLPEGGASVGQRMPGRSGVVLECGQIFPTAAGHCVGRCRHSPDMVAGRHPSGRRLPGWSPRVDLRTEGLVELAGRSARSGLFLPPASAARILTGAQIDVSRETPEGADAGVDPAPLGSAPTPPHGRPRGKPPGGRCPGQMPVRE